MTGMVVCFTVSVLMDLAAAPGNHNVVGLALNLYRADFLQVRLGIRRTCPALGSLMTTSSPARAIRGRGSFQCPSME